MDTKNEYYTYSSLNSSSKSFLGGKKRIPCQKIKSTYEVLDTEYLNTKSNKKSNNSENIMESEVKNTGLINIFGNSMEREFGKEIHNNGILSNESCCKEDKKTVTTNSSINHSKSMMNESEYIFKQIDKNKVDSDFFIENLSNVEKNMRIEAIKSNHIQKDDSVICMGKFESFGRKKFSEAKQKSKMKLTQSQLSCTLEKKYQLLNTYLKTENDLIKDKLRVIEAKKNNHNILRNKLSNMTKIIYKIKNKQMVDWLMLQAFVRANTENIEIKILKDRIKELEYKKSVKYT